MTTLEEDKAALRKAVADLGYEIVTAIGLVRLARRLGMTPRPWIT